MERMSLSDVGSIVDASGRSRTRAALSGRVNANAWIQSNHLCQYVDDRLWYCLVVN